MNFLKTVGFTATILCLSKLTVGQHYDADIHYADYSSEHEGGGDGESAPEDTGFVTPLDFAPLFGSYGGPIGLAPVAEDKYPSIFDIVGSESKTVPGASFFQEKRPDKQFSAESFGFHPQFSRGLASEALTQHPKRVQTKTVAIQKTQATKTSSTISRAPKLFNIKTKHEINDDNSNPKATFGENSDISAFAPLPAYQGLSERYSGSNYPFSHLPDVDSKIFRQKRYSGDRRKSRKSKQEPVDDYGIDYKSKPKDFEQFGRYTAEDDEDDDDKKTYEYGEDEEYGFDEYSRIKSLSDKQAAEIKKHPEHCKSAEKDGMTCNVCVDPKSGASYESCSYVAKPKNNKYAYVKERKSEDDDEEEPANESGTSAKLVQPTKTEEISYNSAPSRKGLKSFDGSSVNDKKSSPYTQAAPSQYDFSKPVRGGAKYPASQVNKQVKRNPAKYENYYAPSSNAETKQPKFANYQQAYNSDEEEEEDEEESDESDRKSAEEGSAEQSDDGDNSEEYRSAPAGFFTDNEEKKDVESVLADFQKKDRSSCKKVFKKHMTCYICKDKKGMKHEECMFVSESAPKETHLAYKEVKEFNTKPQNTEQEGNVGAESKVVVSPTGPVQAESIKLPTLASPTEKYVSSTSSSTTITNAPLIAEKRTIKITKRSLKSVSQETKKFEEAPSELSDYDRIDDPEAFASESRGAFWEDTVPLYDKVLGISLPRYMLEKTEDEVNFDKTLLSGK